MYRIIIEDFVVNKIDNSIDSYTNTFLKRFNDTWIFDEFLIIEEYKKSSNLLNENIYKTIQAKLTEEKVLWYKKISTNKFESIIFVWNYMVILLYIEDIEIKMRYVDDISFHKK